MLIGLPDLAKKKKKLIENRDKSKITKHLIFTIFVKGRQIFTNLIIFNRVLNLFQVISPFSCVLMQYKCDKF